MSIFEKDPTLKDKLQGAFDNYYKRSGGIQSREAEQKMKEELGVILTPHATKYALIPIDIVADIVQLAYNVGWAQGYYES